jgi:photosystem II stability/assembly factor-like uncharacterized protein
VSEAYGVAVIITLAAGVCGSAENPQDAQGPRPSSAPYVWKSVQMVGGGFVDGIVFHSTAKGVRYCRTDMGGCYRWNDQTRRWEPLLDWLPYEDINLMGVESIALDPSDPNRVYLACGTYTNSANTAILRSNDRGRTFDRTNVPLIRMGGNEDGRGNGERMAVDPHDGRVLYFGSRQAGLWKSTDQAVTWRRVDSFPDVNERPASPPAGQPSGRGRGGFGGFSRTSGIVFVVFDPRSGSAGKACSTIYAGASLMGRENLFRSADGGLSWQAVPGEPTQYRPNHAVLASDETLYLSYGSSPGPSRMSNGGVWKLDTASGQWTDITPDRPDPNTKPFGYAAVSVDASNPKVVIASSFYRPGPAGGEDIFRSTDAGKTWKPVFGGGGTYDFSLAPYVAHTGIHWLFDIEIDPANPNHALFTTGFGGFETFNLTDMDSGKPTKWSVMTTGVEETVALDLLSPPKGARLITAIGDYGGFVHWDLDKPSPEGNFDNPHFGNTNSVSCAENRPEIVVRVGRASGNRGGGDIGYSLDGGKTWQPATKPQPTSSLGHVAVSADGETWIWAPQRAQRFGRGEPSAAPQQPNAVFLTRDKGTTWTECQGLPEGMRVIADRANPKAFYAMDLFGGKLFVSTDAGSSFGEQPLTLPDGLPQRGNRGDSRGGQDRLYATPGREADLWLAAFNGLYHSIDTGKTFTRLARVTEIHGFGFGKAAPGRDYSALYLIGVVDGVRGIFRSDDTAKTWVRINDDQHQWGLLLHITGDPKQYGRVYVGTHGRGTVYGDPVN